MKLALTNFSLERPRTLLVLVALVTALLGAQMPKVNFDNDPENMLSKDEPVRHFHHQVKDKYDLYDFVVVGIVNETDPNGIFNVDTLGRIHHLTGALMSLERNADGLPVVTLASPDGSSQQQVIDLRPDSAFQKVLNIAFRHDPNRLFDGEGHSAIIAREVISPSVVDNIKQAEQGSLKLEYLMEHPPKTQEDALTIREDTMSNPLYKGTLVSENGKALCLYIPIIDKTMSYNVAQLVGNLTADWEGTDQIFITGLPVAEDTFGVEMLVQMATSAPMAGIAIFILMFIFFRRLNLIIAPMVVAVVSIVMTMGLLIGLGFDVHIMSSMIAIFLMPIAVADAIHILSEFYDTYPRFQDKAKTIRHVVGHLFSPMLYTTLTTMVGFGSLATTPIPPVKVFGLHVAFGVFTAWLLTMTLVPAYVMLFVSDKSLKGLTTNEGEQRSGMSGFLERVGTFSFKNARLIVVATMALLMVAVYGISQIRVNDNPVKWFTPDHDIRVADRVLNEHFGGTYTAYLSLKGTQAARAIDSVSLVDAAETALNDSPEGLSQFREALATAPQADAVLFFDALRTKAETIDTSLAEGWLALADEVNYLDETGLTKTSLKQAAANWQVPNETRTAFLSAVDGLDDIKGVALLDAALEICDTHTSQRFTQFVEAQRQSVLAPSFKRPETLRWLDRLATHLEADEMVGKTSTVVHALKKAAYELQYEAPDFGEDPIAVTQRNKSYFAVPGTVPAVAQVYTQLEGMKKKDSLFHLVTRDYEEANVWVQLKSGDNRHMERVVAHVEAFLQDNPAPVTLETGWAGLTYINVAWQDKMVKGMLTALLSSFVFVLLMMIILFRSVIFGILAMIPLTVTITLTYGIIGLAGKDYDMPIAVLSSLTLGLSVDFAIHFLQRSRELQKTHGWRKAIGLMFQEPATAISRNAVTISIGFTPLLLAPLVPYKTVGFFLATIMAVSWLSTLFILAALVTLLRGVLFGEKKEV